MVHKTNDDRIDALVGQRLDTLLLYGYAPDEIARSLLAAAILAGRKSGATEQQISYWLTTTANALPK